MSQGLNVISAGKLKVFKYRFLNISGRSKVSQTDTHTHTQDVAFKHQSAQK